LIIPFSKSFDSYIRDRKKSVWKPQGIRLLHLHRLQLVLLSRSPNQDGIAERFVLSVRTDLTKHVIVFNEDHLRRLMKEYVEYYNKNRCHLSLNRDSPLGRTIQDKPSESSNVVSVPKLSGLQHKYEWKQAA